MDRAITMRTTASSPDLAHVPVPHWTELSRTEHWIIERDSTLRIIRLRRTSTPMLDVEAISAQGGALERVTQMYDVSTHGALVDLRAAPLRSDPKFEASMRSTQQRALAGFGCNAVLVATAVGKLQVSRARREAGFDDHAVFQDEREAVAFLIRAKK